MTPQEALLQLPAKPATLLLDTLVAIRRQSIDDPDVVVPIVTLHLRNGRVESGWVVNRALDEKYGDTLLFQPAGGDFEHPHADAMYIPGSLIDAVTVHSIGPVAHLLSFGAITTPIGAVPPTRLELRAKADQLSKSVSAEVGATISFEVSFEGVADSGELLSAMLSVVKETATAIKVLAKDALGKNAFAKSVQKVQFAEGPKAAALSGGTLRITAALAKGADGRLDKSALQSAISGLL